MADKDWGTTKAIGVVFSLGATVGFCVLAGYWVGSFIDRKLHTAPWFTVGMVLLGIAGAFKTVFDLLSAKEGGD